MLGFACGLVGLVVYACGLLGLVVYLRVVGGLPSVGLWVGSAVWDLRCCLLVFYAAYVLWLWIVAVGVVDCSFCWLIGLGFWDCWFS